MRSQQDPTFQQPRDETSRRRQRGSVEQAFRCDTGALTQCASETCQVLSWMRERHDRRPSMRSTACSEMLEAKSRAVETSSTGYVGRGFSPAKNAGYVGRGKERGAKAPPHGNRNAELKLRPTATERGAEAPPHGGPIVRADSSAIVVDAARRAPPVRGQDRVHLIIARKTPGSREPPSPAASGPRAISRRLVCPLAACRSAPISIS